MTTISGTERQQRLGEGAGAADDAVLSQSAVRRAAAEQDGKTDAPTSLDTVLRIPVVLQVVLGSATMPVANLMKLGRGAVVPLDHRIGDPVDVVVNGRVIARGEVVVVDDNSRFGVSLTEIAGVPGGLPAE
jgi:flagellar motor switch protein FliN/FliY